MDKEQLYNSVFRSVSIWFNVLRPYFGLFNNVLDIRSFMDNVFLLKYVFVVYS